MRWWSGLKPCSMPQSTAWVRLVDADLAVGGADVGLDRVQAEERRRGDLGVALALGDQGEDLRLAVGEALGPAGPVEPGRARASAGRVADHHLAGVDGFEGGDQLAAGQRLGQVAVGALDASRCRSGPGGSSRCRRRPGGRGGCRPARRSRRGRPRVGRTSRTGRCRRRRRAGLLASISATTIRSR